MPLGATPIGRRVTTIVTVGVGARLPSLLVLLAHHQAER